MKKNIYFHYGYNTDDDHRIQQIKQAGFDGVFLFDSEDVLPLATKIKRNGLEIEALHLPFTGCNAIWLEDATGDEFINQSIAGVKRAKEAKIDTVVFHITSKIPPGIHPMGIARIQRLLSVCEQEEVYLTLENLRRLEYLDYILKHCPSDYLRFCFDSGHAHAFTNNLYTFPWEKYQHKLHCIHLNDNDGVSDLHLLPFTGSIDWQYLARELSRIGFSGPLTLESVNKHQLSINEQDYLQMGYNALKQIEEEMGKSSEDC